MARKEILVCPIKFREWEDAGCLDGGTERFACPVPMLEAKVDDLKEELDKLRLRGCNELK